jgi:hypothetical protein
VAHRRAAHGIRGLSVRNTTPLHTPTLAPSKGRADPLHGTGIDTKPSGNLAPPSVRPVRPRLGRNAAPLTPSAPAPICRRHVVASASLARGFHSPVPSHISPVPERQAGRAVSGGGGRSCLSLIILRRIVKSRPLENPATVAFDLCPA